MNIIKELKKIVGKNNVQKNVSFKKLTTFQIGGNALVVVTPNTIEEIVKVQCVLEKSKLPVMVLGNGSNILARDGGYNGVILKIGGNFKSVHVISNEAVADAGIMLGELIVELKEKGLCGFENLIGIPGTLGGAIYMNAGAYGTQIGDYVTGVFAYVNHKIQYFSKEELKFGYRHSVFQELENVIILRVELKLVSDKKAAIHERMVTVLQARKNSQPISFPSAGSIFKKIETENGSISAGKLIDDEGLKGMRKGGAVISNIHANFIVNVQDATCDDVLYLINYVKKIIFNKYNLCLIPEIKIIGEE